MNTFILAAIGVFLMAQTVFGAEAKSVCDGKILYMISMTPTGVKQIDTLRLSFRRR